MPPTDRFTRSTGVTILAVLDMLGGLAYLAVATLIGGLTLTGAIDEAVPLFVFLAAVCVALSVLYLAAGVGMWQLKPFGRTCQLVVAIFWLLSIPIGTIIGGMVLYYLTRPGATLLFSGRAPASMSPEEHALVERDASSGALIAVVIIVVVLGGIALLGIVAAIAIPGLLRARMAGNEASAIGRLRAMASGQAVYSSVYRGSYGTVACLATPSASPGCPPPPDGGDAPTTPYLSSAMTQPIHSGYVFRLELTHDHRNYTYFAAPETPGTTGNRAFCVDATGTVLEYLDDTTPAPVANEPCPDGGRPLM